MGSSRKKIIFYKFSYPNGLPLIRLKREWISRSASKLPGARTLLTIKPIKKKESRIEVEVRLLLRRGIENYYY